VKVLLDENFPLPLLEALRREGIEAEHLSTLGQRGLPDRRIRERLDQEPLLFLTQDIEFISGPRPAAAWIIVSRVKQSRPIHDRVETWLRAIRSCLSETPAGRVLELMDEGQLVPWFDDSAGQADSRT
jgi:predicted nuclease of predicted toxin-antitoxin system